MSGPGFHIDLAGTRRERYSRPGALPSVEPATIGEDLLRRDFSINAIALRLTPPAGEVIDPTGGLADLEARLVGVLHERSFQDDATRMLRACRYAARLAFNLNATTEGWLRRDLAYLATISGPRLRRELCLLFEADAAVAGTLLADRLGVLAAVQPKLGLNAATASRWQAALQGKRYGRLAELGFCLTARCGSQAGVDVLSARLHLSGRIERALSELLALRAESAKLAASSRLQAVELLERRAPAAVWALSILDDGAPGEVCRRFLEAWRHVRTALDGYDLLALGIAPGAPVGEALRELRREMLEGRLASREDEVDFVRRLIAAGKGQQ